MGDPGEVFCFGGYGHPQALTHPASGSRRYCSPTIIYFAIVRHRSNATPSNHFSRDAHPSVEVGNIDAKERSGVDYAWEISKRPMPRGPCSRATLESKATQSALCQDPSRPPERDQCRRLAFPGKAALILSFS